MGTPFKIHHIDKVTTFHLTNSQSPHKEDIPILMDTDDFFEFVNGSTCWFIYTDKHNKHYVRRTLNEASGISHYLHWDVSGYRFTGVRSRFVVDHINGNSLDNRKINLRPLSRAVNAGKGKFKNDESFTFRGITVSYVKKNNGIYRAYRERKILFESINKNKVIYRINRLLEEEWNQNLK